MSWAPNKNLIGKKVTASTTWDLGPFGTVSAKTAFTVRKPEKAVRAVAADAFK